MTDVVVTVDEYSKARERAAALGGRDHDAERLFAALPWWRRVSIDMFFPIRVGKVDFRQETSSAGTLPLYLARCAAGHLYQSYRSGFSADNERLVCHCGHTHYMATTRMPGLRALVIIFRAIAPS